MLPHSTTSLRHLPRHCPRAVVMSRSVPLRFQLHARTVHWTLDMHQELSRACCTNIQATYSSIACPEACCQEAGKLSYMYSVPFIPISPSLPLKYRYTTPPTSWLAYRRLTYQSPRYRPHCRFCPDPIRSSCCEPDLLCIPCT